MGWGSGKFWGCGSWISQVLQSSWLQLDPERVTMNKNPRGDFTWVPSPGEEVWTECHPHGRSCEQWLTYWSVWALPAAPGAIPYNEIHSTGEMMEDSLCMIPILWEWQGSLHHWVLATSGKHSSKCWRMGMADQSITGLRHLVLDISPFRATLKVLRAPLFLQVRPGCRGSGIPHAPRGSGEAHSSLWGDYHEQDPFQGTSLPAPTCATDLATPVKYWAVTAGN